MKVFHDGIIITETDNVVFMNKQIQNTLDIKLNAFTTENKDTNKVVNISDIESKSIINKTDA